MSKASHFAYPETEQAAVAARPVRFVLFVLLGFVSLVALWQIGSSKSAVARWRSVDVVVAALTTAYAYVTLIFLRKCSRAYYRSNGARKELHGYLYGRMPIIKSIVNIFEFGSLTPLRSAAYIGLLVYLTIALVQPRATFDWMRWLASFVLIICIYGITRLWAKAAYSLTFFPYPHGTPMLPKLYLSTLGTVRIPGDWKCYESPKPGSRPRCFLSYRRTQEKWAIRTHDALIGAGIDVDMYDPARLWKDGPYEIGIRIEENADCLLYLGLGARRSRWVRVEQDWAKGLARPVFLRWKGQSSAITIQRIVRSSLVPRVSFGEHSKITTMDTVFQRHLTSAEVVESKALNRTSGFTMMRRLGYETQLNDIGKAIAEGRFLLIRTIQILATLFAFLMWALALRKVGHFAIVSIMTVFSVLVMIKYVQKKL